MAFRRSTKHLKLIEKICGRVFCHNVDGGGNPITIFSSVEKLLPSTKIKLAKECDWESVFITKQASTTIQRQQEEEQQQQQPPQISFYMPSGNEVSFCAHAAMGACYELGYDENGDEIEDDDVQFMTTSNDDDGTNDDDTNTKNNIYNATLYEGDIVALQMNDKVFTEERLDQLPTLYRILRDYLHVDKLDYLDQNIKNNPHNYNNDPNLSTMCNTDITGTAATGTGNRAKTLIYLNSMHALNNIVKAPKFSNSSANHFENACTALTTTEGTLDSTGVYVYAKREEDDAWECRQFPKASGYPEDPATGVAAAALVCSFYQNGIILPAYKIYQGTAMGKASLIVIDEVEMTKKQEKRQHTESGDSESSRDEKSRTQFSFRILGRVEIDERSSIDITEE